MDSESATQVIQKEIPSPAISSSALRSVAPTVKVTKAYDAWWRFASERQRIYYKRLSGDPAPWTDDPVLTHYRFTNAFRAADRVSQYLIRNVIYQEALPQSANEVAFRILLFKLFNKIETWETIVRELGPVVLADEPFAHIKEILESELRAGRRIYSAAYIMPTALKHGTKSRKHETHLELLQVMMNDQVGDRLADTKNMKDGFDLLRSYPTIGDFLAYQFITDINYSQIVDYSETEFVAAGPGAREGLRKCFAHFGGRSESELIRLMMEIQEEEFERLDLDFQGLFGRRLQLIDCQNLFCEVAKYSRVRFPELTPPGGRVRIKQKYRYGDPIEIPFFPPKWSINQAVAEKCSPRKSDSELDLARYQQQARLTSFHEPVHGGDEITTPLLGLIGEIGEVVSELKKHSREGTAYVGFSSRLAEEIGDVLWYVSDIATRCHMHLNTLEPFSTESTRRSNTANGEWIRVALSLAAYAGQLSRSYDSLLYGHGSSDTFNTQLRETLTGIVMELTRLTSIYRLSFAEVASENLEKVNHRWTDSSKSRIDSQVDWSENEQLPLRFDVWLNDFHGSVTSVFSVDGGETHSTLDSLTDNAYDPDGYRFHDVFHFAYTAVLSWSPVTRSLLRRKRKSDPQVDEVEDGGRAIAIEEGIAAMVFAYGQQHHMFQGIRSVDYSLLRTIRDMTTHLEVGDRSAAEWENAIIQGFETWRQVRKAGGGHIHVDRSSRQICFVSDETVPSSTASLAVQ